MNHGQSSPFYHDALRKQRYEEFTTVHPSAQQCVPCDICVPLTTVQVKAQELEALADAVRSENYRLYALQAQAQ